MKSIEFNKLRIIKANPKFLSEIDFDCGDDLNEFLFEDSLKNINNKLCTIFLCIYDGKVVGFFSLSADSIKINDKLIVNYPFYPAIKIGRLAVSKDFQNRHIGSVMVSWIVGFCRSLSDEIGIRFISVDAYNNGRTIKFYENNFFVPLEHAIKKKGRRNIPMYRDICEKIS